MQSPLEMNRGALIMRLKIEGMQAWDTWITQHLTCSGSHNPERPQVIKVSFLGGFILHTAPVV